jgi:transcription elongation factor Elf1
MAQHYILEFRCPRCRKTALAIATKRDIPPPIICEACIRTADKAVEMGIVQVTVQQGASQ